MEHFLLYKYFSTHHPGIISISSIPSYLFWAAAAAAAYLKKRKRGMTSAKIVTNPCNKVEFSL